jgi:hypothetical protein
MSGEYFTHVDNDKVEIWVWSPRGGAEIEVYDARRDKDESGSMSIIIPKHRVPELVAALTMGYSD